MIFIYDDAKDASIFCISNVNNDENDVGDNNLTMLSLGYQDGARI